MPKSKKNLPISENKKEIRALVEKLRRVGVIRFDSEVAERIGYHKTTLSQALSLQSQASVSDVIVEKIKTTYSKELKYPVRKKDVLSRLAELEKRVRELEQLTKKTGR